MAFRGRFISRKPPTFFEAAVTKGTTSAAHATDPERNLAMGQVGYRISNGHSGRAHWRFVPTAEVSGINSVPARSPPTPSRAVPHHSICSSSSHPNPISTSRTRTLPSVVLRPKQYRVRSEQTGEHPPPAQEVLPFSLSSVVIATSQLLRQPRCVALWSSP